MKHADRASLPQGSRRDPVKIFNRIKPVLDETVESVVPDKEYPDCDSYGTVQDPDGDVPNPVTERSSFVHSHDDLGDGVNRKQQRSSKASTTPSGNPVNLRHRQQVPRRAQNAKSSSNNAPEHNMSSNNSQRNFVAQSYGEQVSRTSTVKPEVISGKGSKTVSVKSTTSVSDRKDQSKRNSYNWGDGSRPEVSDNLSAGSGMRQRAQTESTVSQQGGLCNTAVMDNVLKVNLGDDSDSEDIFRRPLDSDGTEDAWEEVPFPFLVA